MKKLLIGMLIIVVVGAGLGVLSCTSKVEDQGRQLLLSDYPKPFEEDAMIIVGENASLVELEGAMAIAAKLEELTGVEPLIKNDTGISESDKASHNLIVIGTPDSNSILQEVYNVADATRVTEEYPGENKGILEILDNPWHSEKALLIVAGSDEWGVNAGGEMLTNDEKIKELSGELVVTEFENEVEMTASDMLNSVMDYIKRNHPDAAAFIKEDMSWTKTSHVITVGHTRNVYAGDGWTVTLGRSAIAEMVYDIRAEYNDQRIVWVGMMKDGVITERSYTTE